jgi:hypothetical protein
MRVLWTLLKVVLVLALVIPVGIIAMATVLGLFGALVGLAFVALRLAIVGLLAYGAFKLVARLLRGSPSRSQPAPIKQLPPVDPYYEASLRELDRELGHSAR